MAPFVLHLFFHEIISDCCLRKLEARARLIEGAPDVDQKKYQVVIASVMVIVPAASACTQTSAFRAISPCS